MITSIVIILLSLIATGFFSGLETGNYTLNKIRLHYRVDKNDSAAITLKRNLKYPKIFIFMTLIGHNMCAYFGSKEMTAYYTENVFDSDHGVMLLGFFPWNPGIAATVTLLLPFFIFSEVGPKNLFRVQADTIMYKTAKIQSVFLFITYPITWPLKKLAEFVTKTGSKSINQGIKDINQQKIKFFLDEGKHEGTISERQNKMINNVILLNNKPIKRAIIPADSLTAIEESSLTVENCIKILGNKDINDIPIYKDTPSNITGIIDIFDIMTAHNNKEVNLKALVKPMFYISNKLNMQQAFYVIQRNGEVIAAVRDEDGKALGLVRLKDIVRYITGHN